MGGWEDEADSKGKLVEEICAISRHAVSCARMHSRRSPKPPFIDWYLLLRVGEDSGIDVIRKQYRNIALLVHPDKNKHPRAEFAFKLVSQAYTCLSDNANRTAFNWQRSKSFCPECRHRMPPAAWRSSTATPTTTSQLFAGDWLRTNRERFVAETRVMVNCTRQKAGKTRNESRLFDPSDYVFQGYPHRWVE